MAINKKPNPFFSIITCTYNSENFLKNNLDSVKEQTFRDYEQIIIDGKSKDKTVEIVESFIKINPKIKIFFYPPKGISDAFNHGIERTRGHYVIFLNSDDSFYDKNILRDVYEFFEKHPNLDWIYGKIQVIEEDGSMVGEFPKRKIFQASSVRLLKFINFIPHQAVFMKREVFEKFRGFDTSLKVNMDTDLWLRVASKTNWIFFDKIISRYMLRGKSSTSSVKNKKIGSATLNKVKARHLNQFELFFAKIGDWIVAKINKTYRR